jgi:predicted RNase H-like HicB family nuclease
MIREAIELYIESLVAHGDRVPGPAEAEPRVEVERVTVAA